MTGIPDEYVEKTEVALLSASWPDGERDGFPSSKVAAMIAPLVLEAIGLPALLERVEAERTEIETVRAEYQRYALRGDEALRSLKSARAVLANVRALVQRYDEHLTGMPLVTDDGAIAASAFDVLADLRDILADPAAATGEGEA